MKLFFPAISLTIFLTSMPVSSSNSLKRLNTDNVMVLEYLTLNDVVVSCGHHSASGLGETKEPQADTP